eukprot:6182671-Pleurochrysis_carterae.AAC.1
MLRCPYLHHASLFLPRPFAFLLQADDARATSTQSANASERRENPEVNPITSLGRPAALVLAEVLAH